MINTTKCELCLFLHKIRCTMVWKFCEIWKILWELPSRWAKFCEIVSHSVRYGMYGNPFQARKILIYLCLSYIYHKNSKDSKDYAYCKTPKNSDTQINCCNHPKIWTKWLYCRIMCPKSADQMANSVDPDQTAPLGAVWSGSTLFAQTCLSENLGTLWYFWHISLHVFLLISCSIWQ